MPETERMMLRRANWPDIDDVVALGADAEVMRYHDDGEPLTAARVLSVEMPRLMADARRADELGSWVARDRATGRFLGWFAVTPADDAAQVVALGYRLRPQAGVQGYAVEGALRLLQMARGAQVSTVVARTSVGDVAGRAVLEEIGLQVVAAPEDATASELVEYRLDLKVRENAS